MRGSDGKLCFCKKEGSQVRMWHIDCITNGENEWDEID